MTNIYVLRLQQGRYYIGQTLDVYENFKLHIQGKITPWTQKYMPIAIEQVYKNASQDDLDNIVKEYMGVYGINKVRGGSFSNITFSKGQLFDLKKEVWANSECCENCGRRAHSTKDCIEVNDICGDFIDETQDDHYESESEEVDYFSDETPEEYLEFDYGDQICGRCGQHGHTKVECYDY